MINALFCAKDFEILIFGYFEGTYACRLMDFDELEIPSHCLAAYDLYLSESYGPFYLSIFWGILQDLERVGRKSCNFSKLGLVNFFPK